MKSLSWSQMSTYTTCQRQWMLSYTENLEAIPTKESLPLYRGSMYHRAIEVYLQTFNVEEAVDSALHALKLLTIPNKLIYDYEVKDYTVDSEYYDMVNGLREDMPSVLDYHLPNIGLGTRYRVATVDEVLDTGIECESCGGDGMISRNQCETCEGMGSVRDESPMLEYEFDMEGVHGFIDAVLWDIEKEYYVVVDWKMYSRSQTDLLYEVDGQLHLYASVLNKLGANIGEVIMWRFRASAPRPAKMNKPTSKKPALPSISGQSTTWEHWCATLPYGIKIDLDEWHDKMVTTGKLKPESFFMNKIESAVTTDSCDMTMLNVEAVRKSIEEARRKLEAGDVLPANLNQYSCGWCYFKRLCATPLRYGQDPTIMVEQYYQQKKYIDLSIRE